MQTSFLNMKIGLESKEWLELKAAESGVSVSALVRTAIDFYRKGYHYAFSFPESILGLSEGVSPENLAEINAGLARALEAQNKALNEYIQSKRA